MPGSMVLLRNKLVFSQVSFNCFLKVYVTTLNLRTPVFYFSQLNFSDILKHALDGQHLNITLF